MTVALLLSGAAVFVSVISFTLSFVQTRRTHEVTVKPVLVFIYDVSTGWRLSNVGNGPALNILVAQKRINGEWFGPMRVPPLAKDGMLILTWLGHVNDTGLGAVYTDISSRVYSATCGDDLTRVRKGRALPVWSEAEIGRFWSPPPLYTPAREF